MTRSGLMQRSAMITMAAMAAMAALSGCAAPIAAPLQPIAPALVHKPDAWPQVRSRVPLDPQMEARISSIMARMRSRKRSRSAQRHGASGGR